MPHPFSAVVLWVVHVQLFVINGGATMAIAATTYSYFMVNVSIHNADTALHEFTVYSVRTLYLQ